MPRPKKEEGAAEPKKRSRTGCWPCKARKVKCGEEKPACSNCTKNGEECDYSIRLNWEGRVRRDQKESSPSGSFTFMATPSSISSANAAHEHVFSSQHIATPPMQPTSHPIEHQLPPTSDPTRQRSDSRVTSRSQTSPQISNLSFDTASPPASDFSPEPSMKRIKLSPRASSVQSARLVRQSSASYTERLSPSANYLTPASFDSVNTSPAATPGANTTYFPATTAMPMAVPTSVSVLAQDPPDLRRLSVKSLLADPISHPERPHLYPKHESHGHRTYGYDHGLPDGDIPRNDDYSTLQPRSPDLRRSSVAYSNVSASSADARDMAFEPGAYYANPVAVRIPRTLEPLPPELLRNPINLMYFHHFINHTARIMVPHDCPENPLRRVLPIMAVRNRQLLHLMLAFSASHRAELLVHPVPANRIAEWMGDVLPALRQSLDRPVTPRGSDNSDPASLAPLVIAIMLASLEIMSPNTFEVPISWQNHLDVARQLIVAKGGLGQLALKADGERDDAVFLISRWFAYLDVLGSLSGGKFRQPLGNAYMEDGGGIWLVNRSDEEVHRIDCFLGFSGTCIALLASVADLAAECDMQRIDLVTGRERTEWRPSETIIRRANELRQRLEASAYRVSGVCIHSDADGDRAKTQQDCDEIFATNQAFHWAGMIHISRRILALPRAHPQVQDGVQKVLQALSKVRSRSTAESCLLFPMFSAGCEALDPSSQRTILDRLISIETWGMKHMIRAKILMQKVWETGLPWEVLVNGEFFG